MVQREDATVVFDDPRAAAARYELARLPGVLARRAVPRRAGAPAPRARTNASPCSGSRRDAELRRIVDRRRRRVAAAAGRAPPDRSPRRGPRRPARRTASGSSCSRASGRSARRRGRRRRRARRVCRPTSTCRAPPLLRRGGSVSGGFLAVDPASADRLYAPAQGDAGGRRRLGPGARRSQSFEDTIAEMLRILTAVLVVLASRDRVRRWSTTPPASRCPSAGASSRACASSASPGRGRGDAARRAGAVTLLAFPLGWAIGFGACALRCDRLRHRPVPLAAGAVPAKTYAFAAGRDRRRGDVSGLDRAVRRIDRIDLVGRAQRRGSRP